MSIQDQARLMAEKAQAEKAQAEETRINDLVAHKLETIKVAREASEELPKPKFLRERDVGGNHRLTIFPPGSSPITSRWEGPDRVVRVVIGSFEYCSSGDNLRDQLPAVFMLRDIKTFDERKVN